MKTTKEILTAARALIAKPEAWTQGALAREAPLAGGQVGVSSARATCWCAEGAVCVAIADLSDGAWGDAYNASVAALRAAMGDQPVHIFNDANGHPAVLAAYDRAIASAS